MYLKVDYIYKVLDTRKAQPITVIVRMLKAIDNQENPHEASGVIFLGKRKGESYWFGKSEVLEEFCTYEKFLDENPEYGI